MSLEMFLLLCLGGKYINFVLLLIYTFGSRDFFFYNILNMN